MEKSKRQNSFKNAFFHFILNKKTLKKNLLKELK